MSDRSLTGSSNGELVGAQETTVEESTTRRSTTNEHTTIKVVTTTKKVTTVTKHALVKEDSGSDMGVELGLSQVDPAMLAQLESAGRAARLGRFREQSPIKDSECPQAGSERSSKGDNSGSA